VGNQRIAGPLTGEKLLDLFFIENRTRLLDLAAFLDRIDRSGPEGSSDFRMRAFQEALEVLRSKGDRIHQIQMILSDPTEAPLESPGPKSACGAYDRFGGK
jgi:hypothetical protein